MYECLTTYSTWSYTHKQSEVIVAKKDIHSFTYIFSFAQSNAKLWETLHLISNSQLLYRCVTVNCKLAIDAIDTQKLQKTSQVSLSQALCTLSHNTQTADHKFPCRPQSCVINLIDYCSRGTTTSIHLVASLMQQQCKEYSKNVIPITSTTNY